MPDERIPTIHEEPDDGGNQPVGCPGEDPHGPGGHEADELVKPLTPAEGLCPEDDPEGEKQPEEELLEEPLPEYIQSEDKE